MTQRRPRLHLVAAVMALIAVLAATPVGATGDGGAPGADGRSGEAVITVTSLADSGPGTLRAALTGGGRTVVAAEGLTGTLRLTSQLRVPSHTTVDFSAAAVLVVGWGLYLDGVEDVVIRGLAFDQIDVDDDGDAIRVSGGSHDVLIDRNSFYGAVDGSVDVTQQSTDVTISANRFVRTAKTMLLGHAADAGTPGLVEVTVVANYFDHVGERAPYARHGRFHVTGNVYDAYGYEPDSGYAVRVGCGADVLVDRNAFTADTNPRAVQAVGGDNCHSERAPAVRVADNLLSGPATAVTTGDPQATPLITAPPMTDARADEVRATAGAPAFRGSSAEPTAPGSRRPADTSPPPPTSPVDLDVELSSPRPGQVEVTWRATSSSARYQYAIVRCADGMVRALEATGATRASKDGVDDGCYTARVRQLTSSPTAWQSAAEPLVLGEGGPTPAGNHGSDGSPQHYVRPSDDTSPRAP